MRIAKPQDIGCLLVKCCRRLSFKVTPHFIGIIHHLNIEQGFISPSGNARVSRRTASIVTGFILRADNRRWLVYHILWDTKESISNTCIYTRDRSITYSYSLNVEPFAGTITRISAEAAQANKTDNQDRIKALSLVWPWDFVAFSALQSRRTVCARANTCAYIPALIATLLRFLSSQDCRQSRYLRFLHPQQHTRTSPRCCSFA